MTVAVIFREKPKRWGFRGAPYLWDDLEQAFNEIYLPMDIECFKRKLDEYIEILIGQSVKEGKNVYVEKYDHGGLSSGGISYSFWSNVAVPLLIKRLEVENERLRNK